jgi:peptidyl-dipeptidase A
MTQLMSRLSAMYGEGKYCPDGAGSAPDSCLNLDKLSEILAKSRNYDELVEAWKGWHDMAAPMREPYRRFAELANEVHMSSVRGPRRHVAAGTTWRRKVRRRAGSSGG